MSYQLSDKDGSRIRKNSDVAQFHAKWPEFLRIRLQIDAHATWLKCYLPDN